MNLNEQYEMLLDLLDINTEIMTTRSSGKWSKALPAERAIIMAEAFKYLRSGRYSEKIVDTIEENKEAAYMLAFYYTILYLLHRKNDDEKYECYARAIKRADEIFSRYDEEITFDEMLEKISDYPLHCLIEKFERSVGESLC